VGRKWGAIYNNDRQTWELSQKKKEEKPTDDPRGKGERASGPSLKKKNPTRRFGNKLEKKQSRKHPGKTAMNKVGKTGQRQKKNPGKSASQEVTASKRRSRERGEPETRRE